MDRRSFTASLAAVSAATLAGPAAGMLACDSRREMPPMESVEEFIAWAVKHHGGDPKHLAERFESFRRAVGTGDVTDERHKRAFLSTPRESFVPLRNVHRAYGHAFLDIGYGVTIPGPHVVARMTQAIGVEPGDKVLEIGTGSGYQSAYLAGLTDKVWTIEIVKPLAERAARIRDELIKIGYGAYDAIAWKSADGYHGWPQAAPFDKIIVTCGIDHVPPPLLRQLSDGGAMVIPVGPPGAQSLLKFVRRKDLGGRITVARSDIYDGRLVPFVPFVKPTENGGIDETHRL